MGIAIRAFLGMLGLVLLVGGWGISSVLAQTTFQVAPVTTSDGNWNWLQPFPHYHNFNAVDCPTGSFCIAVGDYGSIFSFDGSIWRKTSKPASLTTQNLKAVRCLATNQCLASGDGIVLKFAASSWQVVATSAEYNLTALDCYDPANCFALDSRGGNIYKYDGANLTKVFTNNLGGALVGRAGISCPAAATCFASFSYTGRLLPPDLPRLLKLEQAGWQPQTGPAEIKQLDCPADNVCLAQNDAYFWRYDGSRWLTATQAANFLPDTFFCASADACYSSGLLNYTTPAATYYNGTTFSVDPLSYTNVRLTALSCPVTTVCRWVGERGFLGAYENQLEKNYSSLPLTPQTLFNLACPAADSCYALGTADFLAYDGVSWSKLTTLPGSWVDRRSMSCPAVGSCFILGREGAVTNSLTIYNGASWTSQAVPFGDIDLVKLDCPTADFCAMVGGNSKLYYPVPGTLLLYQVGNFQTVALPASTPGLLDISCPQAGYCYAVGQDRTFVKFDGTSWAVETINLAEIGDIKSISCPAANRCYAISQVAYNSARILEYDGVSWTVKASSDHDLRDIYCYNPAKCFAPGLGVIEVLSKGIWTAQSSDGVAIQMVACAESGQCFAVGAGGTILSYISPLHVTKTSGSSGEKGTLGYALAAAESGQTVFIDLAVSPDAPAIIELDQSLQVPASVAIQAPCREGRPSVTLSGAKLPPGNSAGLILAGQASLSGLNFVGFAGRSFAINGYRIELACSAVHV